MSKKEWMLTKEQIKEGLENANGQFDLYYNICSGAIDMFKIVNMTSFSVHMALIEATLKDGKEQAQPKTMTLLCDLMIKLAEEYHPGDIKRTSAAPSLGAIEACNRVWGMSRDQALEWLDSDAGVYIPMGGEMRWMSGAAIKSLLEKTSE